MGYLITRNATVSGAEGSCQAEIGSAAAMAAAACVELEGGTPEQCLNAAGNALTNMMGLVCDPVAGLVEVPCQKRNASGAATALMSAQTSLAGIGNLVGFDQTVEAMYKVGRSLPFELRESALGGLAATPDACAWCESHMREIGRPRRPARAPIRKTSANKAPLRTIKARNASTPPPPSNK